MSSDTIADELKRLIAETDDATVESRRLGNRVIDEFRDRIKAQQQAERRVQKEIHRGARLTRHRISL